MAHKTATGAQRYNNRMARIWENARRIERERIARGEVPNPNLTPVPDTLTFDAVRQQLKSLGMTLRHTETSGYRVNYWRVLRDDESTAYYTESLDDAMETGRIMAEACGWSYGRS